MVPIILHVILVCFVQTALAEEAVNSTCLDSIKEFTNDASFAAELKRLEEANSEQLDLQAVDLECLASLVKLNYFESTKMLLNRQFKSAAKTAYTVNKA